MMSHNKTGRKLKCLVILCICIYYIYSKNINQFMFYNTKRRPNECVCNLKVIGMIIIKGYLASLQ